MTLARSESACLVIADISGYTSYLTGSELEHAQDVIADLMEVIITRLESALTLAKLEGDAVFMYTTDSVDGSMLLDLIECAYAAFRRRVRAIGRASTCRCNACSRIPSLDVKFCVHTGDVVRQRIARQEELAGAAVILVHRLLKNSISETVGSHAYALFTSAAVDTLHIQATAAGMQPHDEVYDHLGVLALYVHDLERVWEASDASRASFLSEEQADFTVRDVFPCSTATAWEYLTTPGGYTRLVPDLVRQEEYDGGRRGVGTVTHCIHGDGSGHVEEILEWHPFDDFTFRIMDEQMGHIRITVEIRQTSQGAGVRFSGYMESPEIRSVMDTPEFQEGTAQYLAMIADWFAGVRSSSAEVVAARSATLESQATTLDDLAARAERYWNTATSVQARPAAQVDG